VLINFRSLLIKWENV